MLTVAKVIEMGGGEKPNTRYEGCFHLRKEVKVVRIEDGAKVHADIVADSGRHNGQIHLKEGWWYDPDELKFPPKKKSKKSKS
jgi:hypothetical protein